jgi:hypothetical protein
VSTMRPVRDRLVFEYETERVEWIRSSRVRIRACWIHLQGGPADQSRLSVEILPDEVRVHGEDGRYLPVWDTEVYLWRPG